MRNNMMMVMALVVSGVGLMAGCDKSAATGDTTTTTPPAQETPATKPDNTAMNKVDQSGDTKTPVSQGENAGDIKAVAEIRRLVMDDKGLSMDAKNAKIIVNEGVVTLRGVVDTAADKDLLETKARGVAGVTRVDNQLDVKTR